MEETAKQDPLGIKNVERRVFVTGNYNQLVNFLKRMESYQRIVGIRNLIVAMPEDSDKEVLKTLASEKGKTLELDQPVMTFLMSVYYLP
jgi:Tfp pilus assembly protein PilO